MGTPYGPLLSGECRVAHVEERLLSTTRRQVVSWRADRCGDLFDGGEPLVDVDDGGHSGSSGGATSIRIDGAYCFAGQPAVVAALPGSPDDELYNASGRDPGQRRPDGSPPCVLLAHDCPQSASRRPYDSKQNDAAHVAALVSAPL